jgi:DNA-binding CsgD family transcriptional regulator
LFAAEHPESVLSLMLRTPVLKGMWTRPAIRSMVDEDYELAALYVLQIMYDWSPDFPAERLLPAVTTAQQSDKESYSLLAPGSAMAETALSDYLPRVTVPVLVLGADADEDRDRVYGAAAMLPHAQVALIPPNVINGALGDDWRDAFDAFWASVSGGRPPAQVRNGLSEREIDVIRLLAQGKTNSRIAAALTLSVRTVEHHVGNILAKTSSANRVEAANWALRRGID